MTADDVLDRIEALVEQRLTEPDDWYRVISAVRNIIEDYRDDEGEKK